LSHFFSLEINIYMNKSPYNFIALQKNNSPKLSY
jgi:hypothetical protein